jgi:hypothetical protein
MDWATDPKSDKHIKDIAAAMKGADALILATDPDREGEAISWHVRAMLAEKHALKGVEVQRVTFNEITKSAVKHAMAHPRELDQPLIEAYLARRALDYLVGFTLSPVLWRKLPGSRSAGRVQSVALRLVCEREAEIEVFRAREYWTVEAGFTTPKGAPFTARLTHLEGKKLDQFDLNTAELANRAKAAVEAGTFSVASVEKRRVKRNPPAPFTTSTLQQEASRKLGMGAQAAMRTAQQLYEGVDLDGETTGLITYMRTDGVQMAREAIDSIRGHVREAFGEQYVPGTPREYVSKAKNAQEAHEAVRPTDVARTPESMAKFLNPEQRGLYELVCQRRDKTARYRFDRGFRRVFETLSGGHRRGRGRGKPHAAADGGARPPQARQGERRSAFYPAAAALFGSEPGEEDGGARHRPPLHLRLHPDRAARPQLCADGCQALHSGGSRPAGDGLPDQFLRALCRYRVYRRARGEARRHFRRAAGLARADAHVLGRIFQGHRADAGTENFGRGRCARSRSRAAFLSAA